MSLRAAYPVNSICGVLDLPRSTFYHASTAADEGKLRTVLLEHAEQYPTDG